MTEEYSSVIIICEDK